MGRRMRGEGSIYERKDGYWVAQYKGQYRYAKSRKEAKQKLLELLKQKDWEISTSNRGVKVADFMDRWLEFAEQNLKPATVKRYKEMTEIYVKPNLGTKRMHKVDALTVQETYSRMQRDGLSPATINLLHSVLSSAFGRAVKWGVLNHNVIKNVDRAKNVRVEVETFSHDEAQALIAVAGGVRHGAAMVLALSTGMRIGEILGLEWKHVNLDAGTLDVRQTITIRGLIGTPKSKNSVRTIHLPRIAIDALRRHKKEHHRWGFPSTAGTPIRHHNWVIWYWKPACELAGIRYRNTHVCRHYVASSLLSSGVPFSAVTRFLGHDEATLLKVYSHTLRGMEHLAAAAIDRVLDWGTKPG
jgi:integrase